MEEGDVMRALGLTAVVLLASCIGDDLPPDSPDEAATIDEDAREAGGPADDAVAVPRVEVAQLTLRDGDLTFYSIPALDSVAMREVSRPGRGGRLTEVAGDRSVLATYLAFTAETTPVPRALVDASDDAALRERAMRRGLVDALSAPLPAVGVESSGVAPTSSNTTNAAMCNEGVTSPSFAAEVCTLTVWDVNFCHNGTWYSVTDEVGWDNRRRNSRSRTLACGANGRVRHQYKFGGIWYEPIDETVPSGQRWRWDHEGNGALARKIIHSRTASGFVRGASHFNVPF
jgi:hypothetical protein